jgi:hypothetical protein
MADDPAIVKLAAPDNPFLVFHLAPQEQRWLVRSARLGEGDSRIVCGSLSSRLLDCVALGRLEKRRAGTRRP